MKLKIDIVTIVVYLIIIATLILCFLCEKRDVNCRDLKGKQCGNNMGRAYANAKPDKNDSIEELLKKASLTMRYETNSIFWRRSFVAAIVIAFIILFTVKNKVPNGFRMLMGFMIAYIVIYLMVTLFQRWVTQPAVAQMDQILDQLKRKI